MDGESGRQPRPNWRDASSYAYTQALSSEGWAWEFLRRNPEYRAQFAQHPHLPSTRRQAHDAPSVTAVTDPASWGLVRFRRSRPRG
jgi:hypothetical protein